ncbi:MAG: hypothetical protein H8D34_14035 [Chloroflexi bacterium]|nr:hypothetical protein [Chloroflexota bacterium]
MNKNGHNPMKGISRIDTDNKSTHGWFVRIYRRKTISKFFSDKKHGGTETALAAAKQWRNKMYEQHPREDVPFFTDPLPQNTTGVHGVTESYDMWGKGSNRRKVPYFSVFWAPRRGEGRAKRFYHHWYDTPEEALADAAKFRKDREEEIRKRYLAGQY